MCLGLRMSVEGLGLGLAGLTKGIDLEVWRQPTHPDVASFWCALCS